MGLAALTSVGCDNPPAALRIGAHPWPGYELLYLARQKGLFDTRAVRLIETPSASASLRGLASQTLEGAALTLDEVLTARARGLPLVVVAVLDVSMGADVVMSRPTLSDVPSLRGRRIGVEPGAVGAVMLDALLSSRGMLPQEVQVIHLQADQHVAAFLSGQVDAVVTFEPARSQLRAMGARTLFSSAEVPGRIIDTLAVRQDWLPHRQPALAGLVAGHFAALAQWQADPAGHAPLMAPRLSLQASEVAGAYADLEFPDAAANLGWLRPEGGRLHAAARTLMAVMLRAGLLPEPVDLDSLADSSCLPLPVPVMMTKGQP